jgi:hypothetical protein
MKNNTGPFERNFEYQVRSSKTSPTKDKIIFGIKRQLENRVIKYKTINIIDPPPAIRTGASFRFINRWTRQRTNKKRDATKQVMVTKYLSEPISSTLPKTGSKYFFLKKDVRALGPTGTKVISESMGFALKICKKVMLITGLP